AASAPAATPAANRPAAAAPAAAAPQQIVITGTRASIQGSISRKRNADTVSDSIVAEDIDQFPDKNVGEALSRVSGVQLTREFGEGSQVSIRGVEPDLNRVEINGASVLSTNGSAGRGAELRELAAELIKSIDVVKGSTANLTEGGIGGTVRINTRKPLDFNKRTVAMSLAAEQSSSRGGTQPRATLLLADRFFGNKLGVMANIVYDEVHTRNDYSRNTSWTFLRDWDFSAEKTVVSLNPAMAAVQTPAGCATAFTNATDRTNCQRQWFDYAPRIARYGIWERDHKRSSAELTLQYEFAKGFDAYISHQVNTQKQRLNDMNFGTDLVALTRLDTAGRAPTYNASGVPSGATCNGTSATATPAGMVVENHHVTRYVVGNCLGLANRGGQSAFSTAARNFALDIDSSYTTAGFNYRKDRWRIEGLLVDSKSDYVAQSNNIVLTQNAPGLIVELDSQRLPRFTFPAGYSPDDASSYVQAQLQWRPSSTANTERQGKLDFQYAMGEGFFNRLWFGAQGRKGSSAQYNGGGYLASGGANLASTADDVNVRGANVNQTVVYDPLYTGTAQRPNDAQSFINGNFRTSYVNGATMRQLIESVRTRSPGTFFGGYNGIGGLPSGWTAPSYNAAVNSGNFDTSAFNYDNVYSALGSDGNRYPQIPAFDIRERIEAGYVRLDWGTEIAGLPLDGNVGVRYTRTNVTSSGLFTDRIREESSPGSTNFTDRIRANTIVAIDNTYSDILPSLNGTLQMMNGRLLLRGGYAKVMARPALNLLAPNVNCIENSGNPQFAGGDGTDDCSAGNPDLKPYRATKYDLSLEFYPSRDTQLSAALFRTDIDTYVRTGIRRAGVDFFNDGRLFDVTQPINGEGAQTTGLEIAGRTAFTFLPGWMKGFGVDMNFTRMNYKYAEGRQLVNPLDDSELPYPGLSRNAYNVGLWYDQGMVNARVAYHHRDKYYTGGNDISGNPNFRDATGYLDAKLQLRLTKNFTLSFEGKNLTDQAELTYAGDLSRPNELAWSGRRYYVSVSYKL
ncbi:TonB-dependent receptor, partial [beta proteobacterium AAP121]